MGGGTDEGGHVSSYFFNPFVQRDTVRRVFDVTQGDKEQVVVYVLMDVVIGVQNGISEKGTADFLWEVEDAPDIETGAFGDVDDGFTVSASAYKYKVFSIHIGLVMVDAHCWAGSQHALRTSVCWLMNRTDSGRTWEARSSVAIWVVLPRHDHC